LYQAVSVATDLRDAASHDFWIATIRSYCTNIRLSYTETFDKPDPELSLQNAPTQEGLPMTGDSGNELGAVPHLADTRIRGRVLVVDDERSIGNFISTLLQKSGHDTRAVTSGLGSAGRCRRRLA
jgi:hypothetical protein